MENLVTKCDVLVIGAGMAGFSAALFAEKAGFKTIVAGKTGETTYSSGLIDLLGSFPVGERCQEKDPFELISDLKEKLPEHPYSFMEPEDIKKSVDIIAKALGSEGLEYVYDNKNTEIMIHTGYTKTTYCYPSTMECNKRILEENPKVLIAGFEKIRGFSPHMIKDIAGKKLKSIDTCYINLPFFDKMSSIYTEAVARFMETEANRDKFAELLKPYVKGYDFVGVPTMLGVNNPTNIINDLNEKLGTSLFEIPVMPPSVAGLRLKEAFLKNLTRDGITYLNNYLVEWVEGDDNNHIFKATKNNMSETIKAKYVILATGRFIGKGLTAKRDGIVENVFNLPVIQPEKRSDWHTRNFFEPNPVNQAGIGFDPEFRALGSDGKPLFENLYAAGSILKGNDWKRLKSGSGVAISSAYSAVKNIKSKLQ